MKQELKQRLKQKNLQLNRLSRQYPIKSSKKLIKLSKRSKDPSSNRLSRQYLIRGLEETKEGPDLRIGPSLAPRDRSRSRSRSKSADRKDKKAGGVLQKLRNSCHKEPKAESPVEAEKPAEAEKPTRGGRRRAPGGGGGGGMFEVNVSAGGLPEVVECSR